MLEHESGLAEEPATWSELLDSAEQGRLYAVIDACNMPPVLKKAENYPAVCLHGGPKDKGRWPSAPWLFKADAALIDWVREDLFAEPWGFFLESNATMNEVHEHLKNFEHIADLEKRKYLFRYYDPRILSPFLLSSTAPEVRHFFGPAQRITAGTAQLSLVHYSTVSRIENETYPYRTMRLTEAHNSAFFTYDEERFLKEVIAFILDEFPKKRDLDPDTLEMWCEGGIQRARRNGFVLAKDIMAFVALMFRFAPDFDQDEQVRAILDDEAVAQDQKLRALLDRISDDHWMNIIAKGDPSAWFEDD
ncbi:DUF4123 domain-containing protein [Acanthopleuribacter pedis]|uniref:DUF4123 domain-containing protein n=1 Tax=Acanthopleuribacter pedis TaxID=442870 RepID=A0A8J7Q435_9BACT|nr:DUF4123 domain-containing protein [Acanthopleuribacter pedis]MBO1317311.1 DUF4123 domain-containing protein [Acanthopleuribacter pedis]MBO1318618.1 DUF4123 domain-containing protein [Acanthopleuribacter pedis]